MINLLQKKKRTCIYQLEAEAAFFKIDVAMKTNHSFSVRHIHLATNPHSLLKKNKMICC